MLIKLYVLLKTVFHHLSITVFGVTHVCKQEPSCSRYTVQQIKQHGTIRGLWRGGKRILACR